MVQGMNFLQMSVLAKKVLDNHSVRARLKGNEKSKGVKYMRPQIDMRTGKVFTVILEGWFGKKMFTVCNRRSDEEYDLFQDIMNWLNSEGE